MIPLQCRQLQHWHATTVAEDHFGFFSLQENKWHFSKLCFCRVLFSRGVAGSRTAVADPAALVRARRPRMRQRCRPGATRSHLPCVLVACVVVHVDPGRASSWWEPIQMVDVGFSCWESLQAHLHNFGSGTGDVRSPSESPTGEGPQMIPGSPDMKIMPKMQDSSPFVCF